MSVSLSLKSKRSGGKKDLQPKLFDVLHVKQNVSDHSLLFPGLVNLGNSCYANSVLQALRFIPDFPPVIAALHDDSTGSSLVTHLHQLLQSMSKAQACNSGAVEPAEFLAILKEENPTFTGCLQQDAHEMLRFLLIKLLEGCSNASGKDRDCEVTEKSQVGRKRKCSPDRSIIISKTFKSLNGRRRPTDRKLTEFFYPEAGSPTKAPVHQSLRTSADSIAGIFLGELLYQTQCFECESSTKRREAFMDITVPVTSNGLAVFPTHHSTNRTTSSVGPYSLSWALTQFASREQLQGENKYWCDNCGRLAEAERSIMFSNLPSVLTVHLNRFTTQSWGSGSSVTVSKVSGNLAIPLFLSLKPWSSTDCPGRDKMYELFAVLFHSGLTCSSGHYTTYVRAKECHHMLRSEVKCPSQQKWILFDDDVVQSVSQKDFLSLLSPLAEGNLTAYILFYRRS